MAPGFPLEEESTAMMGLKQSPNSQVFQESKEAGKNGFVVQLQRFSSVVWGLFGHAGLFLQGKMVF